ncbi:putative transcription factor C3H family [Helianthus debilis subsp. tardiflorus]
MRTGICKYGSSCNFNHHHKRKHQLPSSNMEQVIVLSSKLWPVYCYAIVFIFFFHCSHVNSFIKGVEI